MTADPGPFYAQQTAQEPAQAPSASASTSYTTPTSFGLDTPVMDVSVPSREVIHLPFRLSPDPHIYHFRAPKMAVMVLPLIESGRPNDISAMSSSLEWLGKGLGEDDNRRILNRVKDPEDGLDFDTLMKVVSDLAAKVGNRPSS